MKLSDGLPQLSGPKYGGSGASRRPTHIVPQQAETLQRWGWAGFESWLTYRWRFKKGHQFLKVPESSRKFPKYHF